MNIPRIFISYSHDTISHKKWVLELAIKLRNNGIDAIIDQWELKPGDDLPYFMESNLEKSDYILMICSDSYVEKANSGKGGVGYEKMIITSSLLTNINESKIIPILKNNLKFEVRIFLKSKLYIDLNSNEKMEFGVDELIRTIHKSPLLKKPEVGNNPFSEESNIEILKPNNGMMELMYFIVCEFNDSKDYAKYYEIIRNVTISRIYLDLLISEAIALGYIEQFEDKDIKLTDLGKKFTMENKLA